MVKHSTAWTPAEAAAGGGGWGAVVTSNLLVQGANPRKVVGTVNTAEFFVTLTISATFIATLGFETLTPAILGLLAGGILAAPFRYIITKRVDARTLLIMVGIVLTLTSLVSLVSTLA